MHWQIDCPAQVVASVEMAVRSVLGRCELEEVALDDPVPIRGRTARLARAATRSLRLDATSASSVPLRLAIALDQADAGVQVVLRIRLMPGAANDPDEEGIGRSIGGFLSRRSSMRSSSERRPISRPSKPAPAPLDRISNRHVRRDRRPRSLRPEACGGCGAAVEARRRNKTRCAPVRSRLYGPSAKARKSGSSALSSDPELLGALWALPDRRFDELALARRTIAGRFAPSSKRRSGSAHKRREARGPTTARTIRTSSLRGRPITSDCGPERSASVAPTSFHSSAAATAGFGPEASRATVAPYMPVGDSVERAAPLRWPGIGRLSEEEAHR